jgi:hypothetical protein
MKELDLNTFLPNSEENWIIKKDTIYYKKLIEVPLLTVRHGYVWIILDFKLKNQLIKLISKLSKLKVKFFFINNQVWFEKELYEEDLQKIVNSYISAIVNPSFFEDLEKINFDLSKNLTNMILEFGCWNYFDESFKRAKKVLLKEHTDWVTGKKFYNLKSEKLRNYLEALDRRVKLNTLLD